MDFMLAVAVVQTMTAVDIPVLEAPAAAVKVEQTIKM
jgi:hypothetical protein